MGDLDDCFDDTTGTFILNNFNLFFHQLKTSNADAMDLDAALDAALAWETSPLKQRPVAVEGGEDGELPGTMTSPDACPDAEAPQPLPADAQGSPGASPASEKRRGGKRHLARRLERPAAAAAADGSAAAAAAEAAAPAGDLRNQLKRKGGPAEAEGSRRGRTEDEDMADVISPAEVSAAKAIASTLGEKKIHLICRLVQHFGSDTAQAVLEETLAAEQAGGLLTADGKRRKLPGGVFLQLFEKAVPKDRLKAVVAMAKKDMKEWWRGVQNVDKRRRVEETRLIARGGGGGGGAAASGRGGGGRQDRDGSEEPGAS